MCCIRWSVLLIGIDETNSKESTSRLHKSGVSSVLVKCPQYGEEYTVLPLHGMDDECVNDTNPYTGQKTQHLRFDCEICFQLPAHLPPVRIGLYKCFEMR
jgi:hypothetical protein